MVHQSETSSTGKRQRSFRLHQGVDVNLLFIDAPTIRSLPPLQFVELCPERAPRIPLVSCLYSYHYSPFHFIIFTSYPHFFILQPYPFLFDSYIMIYILIIVCMNSSQSLIPYLTESECYLYLSFLFNTYHLLL